MDMEGEAMEGKEEKKFYLNIDKQKVEVSEEIYRVYKSAEEKERYFMKRLKKGRFVEDPEGRGSVYIPGREKSFEKMLDEEWEFADPGEGTEDRVVKAFLMEELETAIHTLSEDERMLVEELYYLEKTEREVCDALHMAKTTLNRRKQAILKKLRERMQEG